MMFQLCFCLTALFSAYGQGLVPEKSTVPSTAYCYVYDRSKCVEAMNNNGTSAEEISSLCSIDQEECVPPPGSYSTCFGIWQQRRNESLPEHTDNSFESTIFMACRISSSMDQVSCNSQCIARDMGYSGTNRDVNESSMMSVSCCCTDSLCNGYLTRILNVTATEKVNVTDSEPTTSKYLCYGLGIAAGVGVVGTLALLLFLVVLRRKHVSLRKNENPHPLEECDADEGSSLLLEQVTPGAEIAQGRYAKVYLGGEISGVQVVIKCFTAAHKRMWQQESDIYRSPGITDSSNIARFFGATQKGSGNDLSMWIVLQYYPNGSIYDYLKAHTLTWPIMLKLAHSMMQGLFYLHDELVLPDGQRRSLAHRDIKSKNILIKDDMTAAIADFGLAQYFVDRNVDESLAQFQAGTHRYMAPEVLDGAIAFTKDSFLRIDVYASALVMWELLTRCDVCGNSSLEYKAPYEDIDTSKYSSLLEALQIVVSKERQRPQFPSSLNTNRHAVTLMTTIEEAWDPDAEARLSAGCIEARLKTLLAVSMSDNMELNNMRNLDPPPYTQHDLSVEISTPLIPYNQPV